MVYNTYEIIIKFTYRKDYLKVLNRIIGNVVIDELKFNYGKNIIAIKKLIRISKYTDLLKKMKIKNAKVRIIKRQTVRTEQLIEL